MIRQISYSGIHGFLRTTFFLLLFLISTLPNSVDASSNKLKVAVFDIAPWGYRNASMEVAGIKRDIIMAISKDIGEDIEIILVPYKRMMRKLEDGDVDFSIFFRSQKSEKSGEPIVRWGSLDIIVIGLANNDILNYEDLKKQTVAVRLGGYFDPKFDKDNSIRKSYFSDYASGVDRLKHGKVSAIVGTAATLYYEFEKQGVSINKLGKPYFLNKKEDWLHFSRKSLNKDKKEVLKKSVKKLIKNGTFEKIFSKYLPSKWKHQKKVVEN